MASPNPDGEFDWTAAEAEVNDVVNLGDARKQRRPENWFADIDDEHDEIGDEPLPVDSADDQPTPANPGRSQASWASRASIVSPS